MIWIRSAVFKSLLSDTIIWQIVDVKRSSRIFYSELYWIIFNSFINEIKKKFPTVFNEIKILNK